MQLQVSQTWQGGAPSLKLSHTCRLSRADSEMTARIAVVLNGTIMQAVRLALVNPLSRSYATMVRIYFEQVLNFPRSQPITI